MKKSSKAKLPKVDPFLEGMMAKLLDRLQNLERKMDKVLSQTTSKGSGGAHVPQQPQPVQPARRERQMYEAICADCSKVCEVPFQPSDNRKVYCKACWARRKGQPHGMPMLTPVALPPRPQGKLATPTSVAQAVLKKTSKKPVKKTAKKGKKK